MNDNKIPNLHQLTPQLGATKTLETIYLEGNPCQKNDQAGYRRKVILALPQVTQVDATSVMFFLLSYNMILILSIVVDSLGTRKFRSNYD